MEIINSIGIIPKILRMINVNIFPTCFPIPTLILIFYYLTEQSINIIKLFFLLCNRKTAFFLENSESRRFHQNFQPIEVQTISFLLQLPEHRPKVEWLHYPRYYVWQQRFLAHIRKSMVLLYRQFVVSLHNFLDGLL